MGRKKNNKSTNEADTSSGLSRRGFLAGTAAGFALAGTSSLWIPRTAFAQSAARGSVKHLLYVRLSGGFRFTTAFNSDVASEFNPFGKAGNVASGTEWGVGKLLADSPFLQGEDGEALRLAGMGAVNEFANEIAVVPCVDHEPTSQNADGNHGSGLERFLTGSVGGTNAFLTLINYGLREQVAAAIAAGQTPLPAMSFGDSGMATGFGPMAAYRPPVIQGNGFENFGFDAASALPSWASSFATNVDVRHRDRVHTGVSGSIDEYIQSREATNRFSIIFSDDSLKVADGSTDVVDGISNRELLDMFGDDRTGRNVAVALRLFRFGCPAIYLNQGGYDLHSEEESRLPPQMVDLNRIISATRAALQRMTHPSGGSFWDHTLVVFGSEFGRTARGNKFNSARGSDHAGDYATRWMSMPMMGGLVQSAGIGGRSFGSTRSNDLAPQGKVYSYRSFLKTLLDLLGADHAAMFQADPPITDFFG